MSAVAMRFRGNAVSASRCGRAVTKVRPPTYFYILLFDLTPVPRHHLYSCRTHKNGPEKGAGRRAEEKDWRAGGCRSGAEVIHGRAGNWPSRVAVKKSRGSV